MQALEGLLVHCARREPSGEGQAEVRTLLAGAVDWDLLLAMAAQERLLPLLRHGLREMQIPLPGPVEAFLESAYYQALLEFDRLRQDTQELLDALREQGVEALLLKGSALGGTLYPNPALRPAGDVDLLIRRDELGGARCVLDKLGYQPLSDMPTDAGDFPWLYGGEVEYVRAGRAGRAGATTVVDVHWHVVTVAWYRYASTLDMDALWAAARPLALEGLAARQLSPEDTLIHLCLHLGIQHGFRCPLLQLADVDRLARGGGLNWGLAVERAAGFGVGTAVYWGLEVARRRLGTEVPEGVMSALRPGRIRHAWTERLLRGPSRSGMARESVLRDRLLRLSLVDDASGAARLAGRTLFPGRAWLAARYAPAGRAGLLRCRLLHPWWVVQAVIRAAVSNSQPVGIFYLRTRLRVGGTRPPLGDRGLSLLATKQVKSKRSAPEE
jgi:hypothetical protein